VAFLSRSQPWHDVKRKQRYPAVIPPAERFFEIPELREHLKQLGYNHDVTPTGPAIQFEAARSLALADDA
jgi:hypothetical protein